MFRKQSALLTLFLFISQIGLSQECPKSFWTHVSHKNKTSKLHSQNYGTFSECIGKEVTFSIDTSSISLENASFKWYKNDTLLNETQSSIKTTEGGSYVVEILFPSCSIKSFAIRLNYIETFEKSIYSAYKKGSLTICDRMGFGYLYLNSFNVFGADSLVHQWYKNDEAIDGANGMSLKVTEKGNYHVTSDFDGCVVKSPPYSVEVSKTPDYTFKFNGFPDSLRTLRICNLGSLSSTSFFSQNTSIRRFVENEKGESFPSILLARDIKEGTYYMEALQGECLIRDTLKVVVADTADLVLNSYRYRLSSSCTSLTNHFRDGTPLPLNRDDFFYKVKNASREIIYNGSSLADPNNYPAKYQLFYKDNTSSCLGMSKPYFYDGSDLMQKYKFQGSSKVRIEKGSYYTLYLEDSPRLISDTLIWKRDGVVIGKTIRDELAVNEPGKYWVEQFDGSRDECILYSDTVVLSVFETPKLEVSTRCDVSNNRTSLSVSVSGGSILGLEWLKDDAVMPNEAGTTINISKPGSYKAQVEFEGKIIQSNNVFIGAQFNKSFVTSLCRGDSLYLEPSVFTTGDGYSFESWEMPNGETIRETVFGNDFVRRKDSGIYKLHGESIDGCTVVDELQIDVKDYVSFSIDNEINACLGSSVYFAPESNPLTDSTETLDYFYISKITLAGKEGIDNPMLIDSNSSGLYEVRGYGRFGCTSSKTIVLNVSSDLNCGALSISEEELQNTCFYNGFKVPIKRSSNLIGKLVYGEVSNPENNEVLTAETFGDTLTFFFDDISWISQIKVKLSLKGSDNVVYYSKDIRVLTPVYSPMNIITASCDSSILSLPYSNISNIRWFRDNQLIPDLKSNRIKVMTSGVYEASYDLGDSNSQGSCQSRTKKEKVTVGINKPLILDSHYATCYLDSTTLYAAFPSNTKMKYQWYYNDEKLVGDTLRTLSVREKGIYKIELFNENCAIKSDGFELKDKYVKRQYLSSDAFSKFELKDNPTIEVCRNTSFDLNVNTNLRFDDITWFKNDSIFSSLKESSKTFTEEGEFSFKGTLGNCIYVSNKVNVVYIDTLSTELYAFSYILDGVDNVGQLVFYPNNTSIPLFNGLTNMKWYLNGEEVLGDPDPNFFVSSIITSESGSYYANGTMFSTSQEECIIQSQELEIPLSTLKEVEKLSINTCQETLVINANVPRGLEFAWFKDSVLLELEKGESLVVEQSGEYWALVKTKEGVEQSSDIYNVNFNGSIVSKQGNSIEQSLNLCETDFGNFELFAPTGFESYNWYKDGLIIENETSIGLVVQEKGLYEVWYANEGCSGKSNAVQVALQGAKSRDLFGEDTLYICNDMVLEIEPNTDSLNNYFWIIDDRATGEKAFTFSEETNGTGKYEAIIEENGCYYHSEPLHIFKASVTSDISSSAIDNLICPGSIVSLGGKESRDLTYTLIRNGDVFKVSNSPDFLITEGGTFQLERRIKNCKTLSDSLVIKNIVNVALLKSTETICENEVVSIGLLDSTASNILWYLDGALLSNSSYRINVSETGNYAIQISEGECIALSDTIQVKNHEESIAKITGTSTIAYGDSSEIAIEISGDASPWKLTLSDGTELNIDKSPYQYFVSPTQTTEYTISSLTDECGEGVFEGSAVVNLIILGTEVNELENIKIYPNPSDSYIFVDYSSEENPIPRMTSMEGKTVPFSYDFSNGKMRIDVSRVASGTYLLSLEQEGVRTIKKLIKR
ncbi:T9SS type A sorting domain-containing protein [uncultured Arcticibacterium sp.]|uniref:T9SS type A sorting domain-containing protein n=1 Tax=uncultured Arcticibacterium sp. TaxID=2173042 RepID=UPI0030F63747